MANARIAAVAFSILSATLLAQQAPNVRLTVTVTDITGAVIAGALVRTDPPSPGAQSWAARTNSQGQAVLNLPSGSQVFRVTAPGFKTFLTKPLSVDLLRGSDQSISVVLQINELSPGPVFESNGPELPTTAVDLSSSLALQPLQQFPLASIRPRRRFL